MLQLLNYTNIRMVEQNSKMTAEMRELAEQNAEQTAQNARQAQLMAVLAYDAKRDSEVMKAITVVTLIFLPATFLSVSPIPRLELTIYPFFLSRQS
jgi:Mg2+ and Co2+ transporter CorA